MLSEGIQNVSTTKGLTKPKTSAKEKSRMTKYSTKPPPFLGADRSSRSEASNCLSRYAILPIAYAIHPSAWKARSPNFALRGFSEVELPLYAVLGSTHSPGPIRQGLLMY